MERTQIWAHTSLVNAAFPKLLKSDTFVNKMASRMDELSVGCLELRSFLDPGELDFPKSFSEIVRVASPNLTRLKLSSYREYHSHITASISSGR